MNRKLLFILLLFSLVANAQSGFNLRRAQTFVATGSDISIPLTAPINYNQVYWTVSGTVTTCTLAIDSSVDGITFTPGGIVPNQTCTSGNNTAVINATSSYGRITVSVLSGAGATVNVTWYGWTNNPAGGGGGTGCVPSPSAANKVLKDDGAGGCLDSNITNTAGHVNTTDDYSITNGSNVWRMTNDPINGLTFLNTGVTNYAAAAGFILPNTMNTLHMYGQLQISQSPAGGFLPLSAFVAFPAEDSAGTGTAAGNGLIENIFAGAGNAHGVHISNNNGAWLPAILGPEANASATAGFIPKWSGSGINGRLQVSSNYDDAITVAGAGTYNGNFNVPSGSGFMINGAAPNTHCLVGNGVAYVDNTCPSGTAGFSVTQQSKSTGYTFVNADFSGVSSFGTLTAYTSTVADGTFHLPTAIPTNVGCSYILNTTTSHTLTIDNPSALTVNGSNSTTIFTIGAATGAKTPLITVCSDGSANLKIGGFSASSGGATISNTTLLIKGDNAGNGLAGDETAILATYPATVPAGCAQTTGGAIGAISLAACQYYQLTLNANVTSLSLSNLSVGPTYVLDVIQNGTGLFTVSGVTGITAFCSVYLDSGKTTRMTLMALTSTTAKVTGCSTPDAGYTWGQEGILTANTVPSGGFASGVDPTTHAPYFLNSASNTRFGWLQTQATTAGSAAGVCSSHKWMLGVDTSGAPYCTQPAFSDLTGNIVASQMLALPSANLYVGNVSNVPAAVAASGDVTLANTGAFTVTKINGTSFAGINGDVVSFGASNTPADSGFLAANVVRASSPGVGIAHFAGSTQVVTSSAVAPSDTTSQQGNGAKFQLSTGSTTTNDCVKFDANGNTVDAGSGCGAGGNTFNGSGITVYSASAVSLVGTQFIPFGGGDPTPQATAAAAEVVLGSEPVTIAHFCVHDTGTLGITNGVYTLFANGAAVGTPGNVSVTVTSTTAVCDDTNSYTTSASDRLSIQSVSTGAGTPNLRIDAQVGTGGVTGSFTSTQLVYATGSTSLASMADFTFASHAITAAAAGILDLSGMTGTNAFKVPVKAGATCSANGCSAFDSTANMGVNFNNGVNSNVATWPSASLPANFAMNYDTVASGNVSLSSISVPTTSYPQVITQKTGTAPAFMPPYISGNATMFSNAKPVMLQQTLTSSSTYYNMQYNNAGTYATYAVPSGKKFCLFEQAWENGTTSTMQIFDDVSANDCVSGCLLIYSGPTQTTGTHSGGGCIAATHRIAVNGNGTGTTSQIVGYEIDSAVNFDSVILNGGGGTGAQTFLTGPSTGSYTLVNSGGTSTGGIHCENNTGSGINRTITFTPAGGSAQTIVATASIGANNNSSDNIPISLGKNDIISITFGTNGSATSQACTASYIIN